MGRHRGAALLALALVACSAERPPATDAPAGRATTALPVATCDPADTTRHAGTAIAGKHDGALGGFRAPRLCPADGVEEYRFLWIRTFHHPVLVHARRTAQGATVRAIRMSGAGGYAWGQVARDTTIALTADDWSALRVEVERSRFWTIPTAPAEEVVGVDGSTWVIEGARPGAFHIVDRWSPAPTQGEEDARIAALGTVLLRLAGELPPEAELLY